MLGIELPIPQPGFPNDFAITLREEAARVTRAAMDPGAQTPA